MTQDGSEMLRQKNAGAEAIPRTALPLFPQNAIDVGCHIAHQLSARENFLDTLNELERQVYKPDRQLIISIHGASRMLPPTQ